MRESLLYDCQINFTLFFSNRNRLLSCEHAHEWAGFLCDRYIVFTLFWFTPREPADAASPILQFFGDHLASFTVRNQDAGFNAFVCRVIFFLNL